ncbi:MAG: hypothetical protein ABJG15_15015 [Hyphomonadaceae bacterium]
MRYHDQHLQTIFRSSFYLFLAIWISPAAIGDPIKVILETDMETDCDDAAALAMLHHFADENTVEILAVISNSASPDSIAGAVLEWMDYDRSQPIDLPVNVAKDN